jgi:branched-subunit amino acid permease
LIQRQGAVQVTLTGAVQLQKKPGLPILVLVGKVLQPVLLPILLGIVVLACDTMTAAAEEELGSDSDDAAKRSMHQGQS